MFGLGGLLGVGGGVSPSATSGSSLETGAMDTEQASDFIFQTGGGSTRVEAGATNGVSPAVLVGAAAAVVLVVVLMRK